MSGPSVVIDGNGNIVLGATASTGDGTKAKFAVARLTPAGVFDPAFNGGAVETLGRSATSTDSGVAVAMTQT
ncbi:MAG TPA: hypothetical protein VH092_14390, partial [Urbifossiella sp.]|nr:hypothetical protein [Urbifossiella sp.]